MWTRPPDDGPLYDANTTAEITGPVVALCLSARVAEETQSTYRCIVAGVLIGGSLFWVRVPFSNSRYNGKPLTYEDKRWTVIR